MQDRQTEEPEARCSLCGGEIYRREDAYLVGGRIVCRDCVQRIVAGEED